MLKRFFSFFLAIFITIGMLLTNFSPAYADHNNVVDYEGALCSDMPDQVNPHLPVQPQDAVPGEPTLPEVTTGNSETYSSYILSNLECDNGLFLIKEMDELIIDNPTANSQSKAHVEYDQPSLVNWKGNPATLNNEASAYAQVTNFHISGIHVAMDIECTAEGEGKGIYIPGWHLTVTNHPSSLGGGGTSREQDVGTQVVGKLTCSKDPAKYPPASVQLDSSKTKPDEGSNVEYTVDRIKDVLKITDTLRDMGSAGATLTLNVFNSDLSRAFPGQVVKIASINEHEKYLGPFEQQYVVNEKGNITMHISSLGSGEGQRINFETSKGTFVGGISEIDAIASYHNNDTDPFAPGS